MLSNFLRASAAAGRRTAQVLIRCLLYLKLIPMSRPVGKGAGPSRHSRDEERADEAALRLAEESFAGKKSRLPGPMVFKKGGTYDASSQQLLRDESQGGFYVPAKERLAEVRLQPAAPGRDDATQAEQRPRAIEELKKRELLRLAQQERLATRPKPRDATPKAGSPHPDPQAAQGR